MKKFDVQLFIIHPSLTPAEITASLGLKAKFKHCVGDQRKTPTGRPLKGTYPDSRWRYSRRYRTKGQWFSDKVDVLVDRLTKRKAFLRKLRASGGRACIIIQLLSADYFSDMMPARTLKKMAELDLDFGIECYAIPQRD